MAGVAGVRFIKAGRIFYYDPGDTQLGLSDHVVARTDQGEELGYVVIAPGQVIASKFKGPLQPIVRKATPEDIQNRDGLKARAQEALAEVRALSRQFNLPMKAVDAFFTLDGAKLTVTYTSEDRVDYRELLDRLGDRRQVQIEMRQIGPRDETKALGGLGRCGRELCCATWLTEFAPITMKMAKEQNLPLSPPGLAGICGKLRCCLRYEYEQYRELRRGLPRIGSTVNTPEGPGTVVVGHPLKQTITVRLESGAWTEVPMEQVQAGSAPQQNAI